MGDYSDLVAFSENLNFMGKKSYFAILINFQSGTLDAHTSGTFCLNLLEHTVRWCVFFLANQFSIQGVGVAYCIG